MRYEFRVGGREAHIVGVEWDAWGRRVYTADGAEVLRVPFPAVRGRDVFTVGSAERHEVALEFDFAPTWRSWVWATDWQARLLVDGEVVADGLDLLPRLRRVSRFLDRVVVGRLLAVTVLLLALAAIWLARW